MNEPDIQAFWNRHPCGDGQVGGLAEAHRGNFEAFFRAYDAFRYRSEAHIPACFIGLRQLGWHLWVHLRPAG